MRIEGWRKNTCIDQSLHMVMYLLAPRVEAIVNVEKEHRSIVDSKSHDSDDT
jgi:hypothetical protein